MPKKSTGFVLIKDAWLRFVITFLIVMTPLYIFYYMGQEKGFLDFTTALTAQLTAKFLYLTGIPVSVAKHEYILFGSFMPIRVIYECTGIFTMIIFFSGVMAYRSTFPEKLIGLGVGLPGIYFTNVFRLIMLALIGHFAPEYFDFFHSYLWYGLFSIIVLGLWLFWVDIVVEKRGN